MKEPKKRIRLSEMGKNDPKSHTGGDPIRLSKEPS